MDVVAPIVNRRLLVLQGLLAGAAVGVVARVWMRLLTTDEPGFTWSGTLFIVGAFTVMGGVAGAVTAARRRGWHGRAMTALRAVGLLAALPLMTGAGIVLAPTMLLGALALGRPTWRAPLRWALVALAAVPVLVVHAQAWRDGLGVGQALVALVLCLAVYGSLSVALAQTVRPVAGGSAVPRRALGLVLAGSVVMLIGLGSAGLYGLLAGALLVGAAAAVLGSASRVSTER